MSLSSWMTRRRVERKLRRGQCAECYRPLPDDSRPGDLCSERCRLDDWAARQW